MVTTHEKKAKIGVRSLGGFVRALVDECPTMNLKTARELFQLLTNWRILPNQF